jgi:hypothetical protein
MYTQTCQIEIINLIETHKDFNTKWSVTVDYVTTVTEEFYQNITWEEWAEKIENEKKQVKPQILFETEKGVYVKFTYVDKYKTNNPICNPFLAATLAVVSIPISLPAMALGVCLFAVTLNDQVECQNSLLFVK